MVHTDDNQNDKSSFSEKIKNIFQKKHKDNNQDNFYSNPYSNYYDNSYSESNINNSSSKQNYYDNSLSNMDFNDINNNDFDNFYSSVNTKDDHISDNYDNHFSKKKIIVVIVLALILVVLLFILIKGTSTNNPDINLLVDKIILKVGENKYLSYEIINTNNPLKVTFKSSDVSVATVDDNGNINGISEGETKIILSYQSGGNTKEKICNVIVEKKDNGGGTGSNKAPTLNLSYSGSIWTNKDAIIGISASSNSGGSVSVKYATNCSQNCTYQTVSGSSITINNNGVTTVTVIATDNQSGLSTTKSASVKVDKTAPTLTLDANQVYTTTSSSLKICATCKDNESGCKTEQVCQTYTKSASNQYLNVQDNAGNKGITSVFNVVISVPLPSCTLSLASDGTVTANPKNATSYSFSSNFTANGTTYKIPDLDSSTSVTRTVTYYVKNSDGKTASCSINVLESCRCEYLGDNGKCYKKEAGRIGRNKEQYGENPADCAGATKKSIGATNVWCYWYTDPGYNCTFTQK